MSHQNLPFLNPVFLKKCRNDYEKMMKNDELVSLRRNEGKETV